MEIFGVSELLSKCIIRPPRAKYTQHDLGQKIFKSNQKCYQRIDFQIINQYRNKLQCSIYQQKNRLQSRPIVIYLHANSSSRLAIRNYLKQLLQWFDVVSFDFSGYGLSEGNYTTLGYWQKQDLRSVIEYLKKKYNAKEIILWGRSMGAVTSILYSAKYNQDKIVKAMVLDSPFSDLVEMLGQLALSYISFLPDIILQSILQAIQQKINETLIKQNLLRKNLQHFNIHKLSPKSCISKIKVPSFFISGKEDKLVSYKHTIQLYEKVGGHREIQLLGGGHNDHRPQHLKISIIDYLKSRLKIGSKKQQLGSILQDNKNSTHQDKKQFEEDQKQRKISERKRIFTYRNTFTQNLIIQSTNSIPTTKSTIPTPTISSSKQFVKDRKKIFVKH